MRTQLNCPQCRTPFAAEVHQVIDVDSNPGVSVKFGIRNIPTILFFKNGEVVDKQVGAVPKQILVNKLEALM